MISLCWHVLPPRYGMWTWKFGISTILWPNNSKQIISPLFTSNFTSVHLQFWDLNALVICVIVLMKDGSKHWLTRLLHLQPLNTTLTQNNYIVNKHKPLFSNLLATVFPHLLSSIHGQGCPGSWSLEPCLTSFLGQTTIGHYPQIW